MTTTSKRSLEPMNSSATDSSANNSSANNSSANNSSANNSSANNSSANNFGRLALLGTIFAILGGCGGENDAVRIDITGCPQTTSGFSLLIRIEDPDDFCVVAQHCIQIPIVAGSLTTDDLEDLLRNQPQPLFDLPAEQVGEVLIAISQSQNCSLGTGFVRACGSGIYQPGQAIEVELDCEDPEDLFCDETAMCQ